MSPLGDPAGYPAEAPAPVSPWQPGASVPISLDDKAKWVARVEAGARKAKQYHAQWKRGLNRYSKAIVSERKKDVNALKDYGHVEGKKAQLFHRTPEVTLLPIDPLDPAIPYHQVLPARQKVLNYELGPKRAHAKRALHKTLIETLASSGFMVLKIGFEQVGLPDPVTGIRVPVWSRRFVSAVSSKKLIIPADHKDSSDFDAASWLAVKGTIGVREARRMGWTLPEAFEGTVTRDEAVYDHDDESEDGEKQCEYTEIWYYAAKYDETVWHPELLRCLIVVEGCDEPAWHVNSPYQTLTPTGELSDDSMRGNPIHVGTLRDLPDSAYVPSDLVVGEQLSDELNNFRTDLINGRKARQQMQLISDRLDTGLQEKLLRDRKAVVPAEHIQAGGVQDVVAIVAAGSEPRDNFTAQQVIEQDYNDALGASSNQRGQFDAQKRTATEVRAVQGNSSARAQTEQDRIREYFVGAVQKFDAVLQRTATVQDVQKILGQQGARLWEQWRILPGTYHYDILPDSGKYVDPPQARAEAVDLYNMTRKDDRVNPESLLQHLARVFHLDAANFIVPPSPKTMEPMKATYSLKTEDLHDPVGGAVFKDFAANGGIKLSPETLAILQAAQILATVAGSVGGKNPDGSPVSSPHGGTADKTEPVNKHQRQNTGGVQGVGAH